MNLTATRTGIRNPFETLIRSRIRSATVYSGIIILALLAFEAVNYSTTAYALRDLLGDLKFAGISWATLMALAFCGLDFAGIARLITQKDRQENSKESWYLFSAWLIAAAFNAALTWWGVSIAIANHSLTSAAVVSTQKLTSIVPVLVAIMVWVIRVLIIGSLTSALEHANGTKTSAAKSRNPIVTTAGFPTSTQSASGYTRPLPAGNPVRAAARVETRPAYKNIPPAASRLRKNDFIAADQHTRDL